MEFEMQTKSQTRNIRERESTQNTIDKNDEIFNVVNLTKKEIEKVNKKITNTIEPTVSEEVIKDLLKKIDLLNQKIENISEINEKITSLEEKIDEIPLKKEEI